MNDPTSKNYFPLNGVSNCNEMKVNSTDVFIASHAEVILQAYCCGSMVFVCFVFTLLGTHA